MRQFWCRLACVGLMFFAKQFSHALTILTPSHSPVIYILIHGTWGADGDWYQPHGDFFIALEQSVQRKGEEGAVISFIWSGYNRHKYRLQAAKDLVSLITTYPPTTRICIVSHSHGTNVVNIASQMLAEQEDNEHCIEAVYAFGTPVDVENYMPNMDIIKCFYHFFSLNDLVQPVLGMYSRQYPAIDRLANLRIIIDGYQPSHNGMRSPLIAEWLPLVHENLQQNAVGNFENFDFSEPGIIYFKTGMLPTYEIDKGRAMLLMQDAKKRSAFHRYISKMFVDDREERNQM